MNTASGVEVKYEYGLAGNKGDVCGSRKNSERKVIGRDAAA